MVARTTAKADTREPKATPWKAFVAIGLLALLLIAAGAYQSWKNKQVVDQNRYNGFDFTQAAGGLWVTKIQVGSQPYNVPFYNHPKDLGDVIVRDHDADNLLVERNRTVQQVYISVDPDAGSTVAAIAGVEVARITGSKYNLLNLPTTGALTRPANVTVDYPILTCEDATNETVVIQFAPDPTTNAIVRDGNCIVLFYKTPNDAVRVADRYAYMLLGIMP